MPAKSNKETAPKKAVSRKTTGIKKVAAKSNKAAEEDIEPQNDETQKMSKKPLSLKNRDEEDDDSVEDFEEDDTTLKKEVEDEDWDPDFDEFDLPKSSKKTSFKKSSSKDADDEFKVDDEFKDYFGSGSSSKKYSRDDDDDY